MRKLATPLWERNSRQLAQTKKMKFNLMEHAGKMPNPPEKGKIPDPPEKDAEAPDEDEGDDDAP